MNRALNRYACLGVSTIALAVSAQNAAAQEPRSNGGVPVVAASRPDSHTEPPSGTHSTQLGDIVVTARRREESLQDVPISIAAIGAKDIANQGARSVTDLQYKTPNVFFGNPGTANTGVYIRGVGDFSRNIGIDTRVAVYVDGVSVGSSFAIDQGLVDVDRVEILRGPQGTLFGKNTVAGAINIVTTKPNDTPSGRIDASLGSYRGRQVSGGINLPLTSNLFVRASAQYQRRDGYVRNVFDGNDLQNVNRITGRVQARYKPTDALTIDLAADAMRDRHTTYYKALIETPLSPGGVSATSGPREVNFNTTPTQDVDVRGASATIDYGFASGGRVVAIGAYRYSALRNADDQDSGPILAADSHYRTTYKQATGEVRYESPGNAPLNYVAGLFYLNSKGKVDIRAASEVFPTSIAAPPAPSDNLLLRDSGTSGTDSYAAFANGTYDLTDELKFELGGRIIRERKSVDYDQATSAFTTAALALPGYQITDSFWKTAFTPSTSVSFKPSNDLLIYARLARGYKSGGYNADIVASRDIRFDPEYVNAAEIGFKSTLLDGHLRLNAAAFVSRHSDYQVFQFTIQGTSTILQLRNAGKAQSKGLEAEVIAEPLTGLRLTAAGGYTDAKFLKFDDCAGIGTTCRNDRLIGAPKYTASISGLLTKPIGSLGEASAFAQYSYRDQVFTNVPNAPNVRTEPIGVVNASLSFKPNGQPFELYSTVNNLFDTLKVQSAGFSFLQTPSIYFTAPRMWEFGIRARF